MPKSPVKKKQGLSQKEKFKKREGELIQELKGKAGKKIWFCQN
jgi:hypothetical protein